jgi:uncharacterized membrane protein YgcG
MRHYLACSIVAAGLLIGTAANAPASAIRTQLNHTLPEVQFNGVAFSDAIDFIRDVSGVNIVVNWKALEEAGVAKDTPINLRLRAISMHKALDMMLTEAGGGDKLSYDIDQNVLSITTREIVDSKMFTRVYPIQDLIMDVPDFTDAPDLSLNSTSNNQSQNPQGGGGIGGGGSGGGSGSSQSLFGGAGGSSGGTKEVTKTKDERAKDLIDLIEAVIQPEIWTENGGKAAIRFWNGNLIVTAPRSVQEAIGGAMD